MGKILCGFVGIGKSTVAKIDKNIKCYDLDSTYFKKNEGWEDVYIDCAVGLSKEYDYVFLTTYVSVMERLNARGVDWYLVYPSIDQKVEYKQRAIDRRSPKEFVEGFLVNGNNISKMSKRFNANIRFNLDMGSILPMRL